MTRDRSNYRLAKALWSAEALALGPSEFQRQWDAIYDNSPDLPTLWRLGGAANDYRGRHPDSIEIPASLPLALLRANFTDARIIDLKLLSRWACDFDLVIAWIEHALVSSDEREVYGGLYELGLFLKRIPTPPQTSIDSLMSKLTVLVNSSDPYVRWNAYRYIECLQN